MSNKKIFKIIEIPDEFTVIINYGSIHGAKKGLPVEIFEIGESVIDSDTNEKLGTLDLIKDTVTIETVYDNFSVARKSINKKTTIFSPLIDNELMQSKTEKSYLKLNVNEKDISHRKIPASSPIKKGDKARLRTI